jgi:hypothetical protein
VPSSSGGSTTRADSMEKPFSILRPVYRVSEEGVRA